MKISVPAPPTNPESAAHMESMEQIAKLANFIMEEIPGEPSSSESAVDCAIRLLRGMDAQIGRPRPMSKRVREEASRCGA